MAVVDRAAAAAPTAASLTDSQLLLQAVLRAADELALLLIRLYRSLSVLVGNDRLQLRHWSHTANRHSGGVPAEQVQRTEGLVEIVQYLDAMRAPI